MNKNVTSSTILGVRTHASPFDSAIRTFAAWASEKKARRVSFCPVYTIMRAHDDPALRDVLNTADYVAADGMPVVWMQRRRGATDAERVYGPDVMLALCQATTRPDGTGLRHFLLGGGEGVADALATTLRQRFPGIDIVGTYAPPFSPSPTERGCRPEVGRGEVEIIHAARPDIVWVALGSPKQDFWMAANQPHLDCLMLGVGAAFDFLSGHKPQAPRWMQRNGLEWAFRLASEPGRLWRRYLVENPRFLWHVLRESTGS